MILQELLLVFWLVALGVLSNLGGKIIEKIKIPSLIGMMLVGMLLGPSFFNLIPKNIIRISPTIKDIALVIILFIGGLGISGKQMKKIGRPAMFLSIIPASLEGFAIAFLAKFFLGFTFIQGAILGFIIAAVSPAVLVPSMVALIERKIGQKKSIPQMLLIGASADDTVAITLFTTFLGIYLQGDILQSDILKSAEPFYKNPIFQKNMILIPVAIVLSIVIGWILALIVKEMDRYIFKKIKKIKKEVNIFLTVISLVLALLMRTIENTYHLGYFNSLLTVMILGFFIRKNFKIRSKEILKTMNALWKYGKLYLFALVGMVINPKLIGEYFYIGVIILCFSLTIRSIGVLISLIGTNLTWREKLFCVIAYLPKATVQSAKAGIPLQNGVVGGEVMQAIAILSVIITAPIGAIGISLTSDKFLSKD